jgi:hypothetical protein
MICQGEAGLAVGIRHPKTFSATAAPLQLSTNMLTFWLSCGLTLLLVSRQNGLGTACSRTPTTLSLFLHAGVCTLMPHLLILHASILSRSSL